MSGSRRIYTAEFKQEAVPTVTKQGLSPSEAADCLGILANLLRRWKQELAQQGSPANPRQPTTLEAENRQLREGVTMRYWFIDDHRGRWPIDVLDASLLMSPIARV